MSKATERAYSQIKQNILSGKYIPGSHLTEEMLAEDINVSRTPVREALRQLNSEYLVKFVPNQGAYVSSWSIDDVDDIFQLRIMLEGYSAFRAASRISDEDIGKLEDCANKLESLSEHLIVDKYNEMIEINHRFHTIIIEAANSDRTTRMLSWLVEMPMILKTMKMYEKEDVERSNRHHRELISALKAKDGAWAQSVMESHLRAAQNIYVNRQELGIGG